MQTRLSVLSAVTSPPDACAGLAAAPARAPATNAVAVSNLSMARPYAGAGRATVYSATPRVWISQLALRSRAAGDAAAREGYAMAPGSRVVSWMIGIVRFAFAA